MAQITAMTWTAPIAGATTWVTVSERLALWGNVEAPTQPYVALVKHREIESFSGLGLLRRRFEYAAWCYARTDNGQNGQDIIDTWLDAFDQSFGQTAIDNVATGSLTFNGLVYWCRIDGRVFCDPGDIDGQALLIVPILVELP